MFLPDEAIDEAAGGDSAGGFDWGNLINGFLGSATEIGTAAINADAADARRHAAQIEAKQQANRDNDSSSNSNQMMLLAVAGVAALGLVLYLKK